MMLSTTQPDLNIVSPENLLNPVPLYRRLQEVDPVHWSEQTQSWFVTRYEDVTACFRDPRLSADRRRFFVEHQLRGVAKELMKDQLDMIRHLMLNADGAEHTRLRRNANPGFTMQAMDAWRPAIRQAADQLLEQIQQQGRMDLVPDFSEPLPMRIIADLFAIPEKDRSSFRQWSQDGVALFSTPVGADLKELAIRGNAATVAFLQCMRGLVEERRAKPGRDMLSIMLQAQEEGRVNVDEVIANVNLIVIAGHITTVDQISNTVHALLTHPDQLQKLKENPSLMKSAVEEGLRYNPAMPFIHRIATEDFELHGRAIKRGQVVFLGMAAANRDPSVFPEPERFDITRQGNKHLAFAYGPHACLGSTLARYDLEIGLGTLFERLPGLRLDEERPARVKCQSLVFRGFDSLPVRW